MSTTEIISVLPLVFIGLAASISLRAFSRNFPPHLKIFSAIWILVFAVEMAGHILRLIHISNHWLYNFLNLFLYPSLAYIYQQQLQNNAIRKLMPVFYIGFPVFVIINSFFLQDIASLQTLILVVGGSFIIFLAGFYFWELYKSEKTDKITKDPFFWFSFGFILYFGCTLSFLGMLNYLLQLNEGFTTLYQRYILYTFSILLNILIIIGFLCRKNYQRLSLS